METTSKFEHIVRNIEPRPLPFSANYLREEKLKKRFLDLISITGFVVEMGYSGTISG